MNPGQLSIDEIVETEPSDRRVMHRFTGALVLMASSILVMILIQYFTLR